MIRAASIAGALAACLGTAAVAGLAAPSAMAVAPALTSVSQQNGHVVATFSAPQAQSVTVSVARSPQLAADGSFPEQDQVSSDSLTRDQIGTGKYRSASPIAPGSYYVMVTAAADYTACELPDGSGTDPACAAGDSAVVPLTVPYPVTRYKITGTTLYRGSHVLYLTVTAKPLGERQAFQACWRPKRRPAAGKAHRRKQKAPRQRCVRSSFDGSNWAQRVDDNLRLSTRGMARRTQFRIESTGRHPVLLTMRTVTTG